MGGTDPAGIEWPVVQKRLQYSIDAEGNKSRSLKRVPDLTLDLNPGIHCFNESETICKPRPGRGRGLSIFAPHVWVPGYCEPVQSGQLSGNNGAF